MSTTTRLPELIALRAEGATVTGPPYLLEVAGVRVVDGEALERFHARVLPAVPIEPAASERHGITDADLGDARLPADVLADLFAWLGDAWLLMHDAEEEAALLGFEAARLGIEPPASPLVDTRELAKRVLSDAADHDLDALAEELELEAAGEHGSLGRAVAVWQVLEACLERDETSLPRLLADASALRTLDSGLPRRPRRRAQLVRRLERARAGGCPVVLTYGDGSEPPARLDVLPRLVFHEAGRDYLEGECQRSGIVKTYRLDRIHRMQEIA